MPLHWNIKSCRDFEALLEKQEDADVTRSIVMASMSIGIPFIETENAQEFALRIRIFEQVCGAMLWDSTGGAPKDRYITLEDIKRRIGLRTNSSKKTKAQFMRDICGKIEERARLSLEFDKR